MSRGYGLSGYPPDAVNPSRIPEGAAIEGLDSFLNRGRVIVVSATKARLEIAWVAPCKCFVWDFGVLCKLATGAGGSPTVAFGLGTTSADIVPATAVDGLTTGVARRISSAADWLVIEEGQKINFEVIGLATGVYDLAPIIRGMAIPNEAVSYVSLG